MEILHVGDVGRISSEETFLVGVLFLWIKWHKLCNCGLELETFWQEWIEAADHTHPVVDACCKPGCCAVLGFWNVTLLYNLNNGQPLTLSLERHMTRHRQKDEEAGAEGCGILNTRKSVHQSEDSSLSLTKSA